ncbi:MAG: nucleotidyltransferase family protein [Oscillospiraceae bacterium]|nr:nucleotidyltransferase family protein [Oscillospiraceae bacterium]
MNIIEEHLLDATRSAVHGETVSWAEPLSSAELHSLIRLAHAHSVLPLVVEAMGGGDKTVRALAKRLTVRQAQRTADFLLLYRELTGRGLQPLVIKGIVLRDLYPQPEQRPSADEDLLVSDEDWPRLRDVLLDCGLSIDGKPADDAEEVTFRNMERGLCLEVHRQLFDRDSNAYGDCNVPFADAMNRAVTMEILGTRFRTLSPTDHMLYLLCHAYKHLLHGGVGIRQICDMGLFTERYSNELDWEHILTNCRELRIDRFAAALFAIGEKYLDLAAPAAFAGYDGDVQPLLEDILSGGIYGAEDIDRLHSSTLTLDAVEADRTGRRRGGALRSVFLPANALSGRYPYLRTRPWLLPVAWTARIWGYLADKRRKAVKPTETLRIGHDRIALLKQYGIIE